MTDKKIKLDEVELDRLLRRLGERWRSRAFQPLTAEEKARARAALDRALAQIEPQPSWRERLARWWEVTAERIRCMGAIPAPELALSPALAFAGEEPGERRAISHTASSADGRLRGTLLITADEEVWVGFETRDAALAGATVRFSLLPAEGEEPARQGEVALEPVEAGVWEGRAFLGRLADLGLDQEPELWFAVVGREAG